MESWCLSTQTVLCCVEYRIYQIPIGSWIEHYTTTHPSICHHIIREKSSKPPFIHKHTRIWILNTVSQIPLSIHTHARTHAHDRSHIPIIINHSQTSEQKTAKTQHMWISHSKTILLRFVKEILRFATNIWFSVRCTSIRWRTVLFFLFLLCCVLFHTFFCYCCHSLCKSVAQNFISFFNVQHIFISTLFGPFVFVTFLRAFSFFTCLFIITCVFFLCFCNGEQICQLFIVVFNQSAKRLQLKPQSVCMWKRQRKRLGEATKIVQNIHICKKK